MMNFLGARDIIDLISKYLCLAGVLVQIPICLFPFLFFVAAFWLSISLKSLPMTLSLFIFLYIPCIMYRTYGGLHDILCP